MLARADYPESVPNNDEDELTTSTFKRSMKLAKIPAGFAARTTVGLGKRMVGTPAAAVSESVQRKTAEQMFSVLGQLKGGAMKFGQAMSVFEAALPESVAAPYRQTLNKLQDAAPPMSAATVARIMATEFGADWETRFPKFNLEPAAAASIGQVHRATWIDDEGLPRDVAVKIQYPGAAEALVSDMKQISRVARLFGPLLPGIDIKSLTEELKERIAEEVDYDMEAGAQAIFAAEYANDPEVFVPMPLTHTARALVSEWVDSARSLADVINSGTQAERDRLGENFVRFLFSGPARIGLLHADPHPGNYRVLADGRLAVVDYGSVARLPEGLPPIVGQLLRAASEDDYDRVLDGLRAEGFILPDTKIDYELMARFIRPLVEPVMTETFSFNREWLREQSQRMSAPGAEGVSATFKLNIPREYLLIHRVWMGGVGVLCQLEATAPFRDVVSANLPGFAYPN